MLRPLVAQSRNWFARLPSSDRTGRATTFAQVETGLYSYRGLFEGGGLFEDLLYSDKPTKEKDSMCVYVCSEEIVVMSLVRMDGHGTESVQILCTINDTLQTNR